MKYHIVSLESEIVEDNYEEGEGESTGCGYSGEKIGKTFDSIEGMVEYLSQNYGLPKDVNDYEKQDQFLYTSKTVANHADEQNGGWFDPTEREIEMWQAGKMKLYSDNYTVKFLSGAFS
jgi:hypothetical protein